MDVELEVDGIVLKEAY